MRILVAPQEFKGTLTARAAAEAIARGLRRALPGTEIDVLAMADGGPGTVEALVEATGGRYVEAEAHDPLGRPLRARWGVLGARSTLAGSAVIEMAAASGLTLLRPEERDPRRASTFGTGELLRAALDAGRRRIIVGAGGSATNDGGAGLAQALGVRLRDASGRELEPGGAALARLTRIDASNLDVRLRESEVMVATDVTNPLCGPEGASLVYGPQKGATAEAARELDAALARFAEVVFRDLGIDAVGTRGAGAAGGLAYGLVVFCGASVRPGFEVVAEAVDFAERVRAASAVVTGEGRLDQQTPFGKTAYRVAQAARAAHRPVIAIAGMVEDGTLASAIQAFDRVITLAPDLATEDEAIKRAGELLEVAAARAGEWIAANARAG
jgi:glycerate kinase